MNALFPFHSVSYDCISACIGCTTARIIKNIKEKINGVDDIDGFEDLRGEDQEKVKTAFEEGHGKQVQRIETQRFVC